MSRAVTVLLTPGGGPGILAQIASLTGSRKYQARIVLADSNPASGNLFLDEVDARYLLPPCNSESYIPALLRLIKKEDIDIHYSGLDEEMPILAQHMDELRSAGCHYLLPSKESLNAALDKQRAHSLLSERIRMPRTFVLDEDFDAVSIYDELYGKVIIKATKSRGGRYIYIPEDLDEYHFYINRAKRLIQDGGHVFVVQELIEGDEYNVSTLHDLSSQLIYAVSRKKFEKRNIKSTTIAAVIEKREDVIEMTTSSLEILGLTVGFNNVEIIVSDVNNKPYFIEVNGGRTAAQDMNLVASGINVTDHMIDIISGEHLEPISHPEDGIAILKIRKDVVVNYSDILSVSTA